MSTLNLDSDFFSINVFVGSSGAGYGYGSVSPAAQVPYGALRIGPDTTSSYANVDFEHFCGYNYLDDTIRGFSHTRLVGAGVADLGNFGVMPLLTNGNNEPSLTSWWSSFDKTTEFGQPGYYSVFLDSPKAKVEELAVSVHAGIHRFSWNAIESGFTPSILFDVCHGSTYNIRGDSDCTHASLHIDPSLNSFSGSVFYTGALSQYTGQADGIWVYIYGTMDSLQSSGIGSATTCVGNTSEDKEPPVVACDDTILNVDDHNGGILFSKFSFKDDIPVASPIQVEVRVAISFVSEELAKENYKTAKLNKEEFNLSFEDFAENTFKIWSDSISSADVVIDTELSGNSEWLQVLRSSQYRTFLTPTIYSESGGLYVGLDGNIHNVTSERLQKYYSSDSNAVDVNSLEMQYFSDLSLWDTFRSHIPYQLLTAPSAAVGLMRTLDEMTRQYGYFPRWPLATAESGCMIGLHGTSSVLEGTLKGYKNTFDVEAIYEAFLRQSTQEVEHNGRADLQNYLSKGYVTIEGSSTSSADTLSYAYDDSVLSKLASIVGDTEVAKSSKLRSFNYRNLWSRTQHIMCARTLAGDLECPKSLKLWTYYVEGDAPQWTYFVPHDIEGLISLYPSPEDFLTDLESFFELHIPVNEKIGSLLPNPYYWAGNEVDMMTPFYFNYVDCTRTQYWTRKILPMHFTNTPHGIPGNDDYGSMAAFVVFSSVGLYPLASTTTYFITSPSVTSATFNLPSIDGNTKEGKLTIQTYNNTIDNVYIEKLLLNGVQYYSPFMEHEDLVQNGGATLEFFMTSESQSTLCKK